MAKMLPDAILDLIADELIANGDEMTLCNAQPTTYLEAHTTFKLADVALAGGDYAKANGDVDGRKVTIAAKSDVTVDATDTGTHVAITDTVGEVLKAVTTCTNVSVVLGGTVDFPAWKITPRDPT